ncbi:hypothetical protein V1478_017216 [Vespula squamosa]|uniref:Uncharacterized protein n=1 Tax=Vespula squamosa TaxID=30214 RepID=A0ABD1ZXD4_VESSQ
MSFVVTKPRPRYLQNVCVEISYDIVDNTVRPVHLEICKMNLFTSGFFDPIRHNEHCLNLEVDVLFDGGSLWSL